MGTKSAWTPERRAKQAKAIRRTKPWLNSTGPKTDAGKATSSQNARLPERIAELRQQRDAIRAMSTAIFGRTRGAKAEARRRADTRSDASNSFCGPLQELWPFD